MKTCLGSLLLVPTLIALVVTAIYHLSVNSELRFEQRDTNTEYINVNRSYRPQIKSAREQKRDGGMTENEADPVTEELP